MSHTPGPWNISQHISGACDIKSGHKPIARINELPDKEGLDNTYLIAAAPELLEIAKGLVKWDFRNNREHFVALASVAIAKAEGK